MNRKFPHAELCFVESGGDNLAATFSPELAETPADFPNHSWIVCAGLGEWGTSGTAWYLAHRWRIGRVL